jgi:hypothetical protein
MSGYSEAFLAFVTSSALHSARVPGDRVRTYAAGTGNCLLLLVPAGLLLLSRLAAA